MVLPLAISFFTFEAISYLVDVYRKRMSAIRQFSDYALFIAFFPHLVAGPIVRASDFVPQIDKHRPLEKTETIKGVELIAFGLFKKVVIADNLAPFVDAVFSNPGAWGGAVYWIAAVAFAVQIYCDFSGYTDIARGIALMLGFNLGLNFYWPYFSRSIREFWRRWHISLSLWLRDYLYIPLGGNRAGVPRFVLAATLTWFLGGLWHGASWTFVLWGLYHGVLVTFTGIAAKLGLGRIWGYLPAAVQIFSTFILVVLGWVLFRASSAEGALQLWSGMLGQGVNQFAFGLARVPGSAIAVIVGFSILHFISYRLRRDSPDLSMLVTAAYPTRLVILTSVFAASLLLAGSSKTFIYFQF